MTVTLTSPVLGKPVGDTYTGDLEDWLLAQGYAKRAGYTGPGVQNAGATDVVPADDPRLPENREAPHWLDEDESKRHATVANEAPHLTATSFANPDFDFDLGGVDTEKPSNLALDPADGKAAGGDVVRISGDNLEGVTGVTFGGTAATSLELNVEAGYVDVTTPAHAAGAVDVVVTDNVGSTTLTGGFTYA